MNKLEEAYSKLPKEDEVKRHFLNTALEPYSQWVYAFWMSEPLVQTADACHDYFRKGVQNYIDECLQVAKAVEAAKKGSIVGRGWKITSPSDVNYLSARMDTYLVQKLYGYESVFMLNLPEDTDKISTARNWAMALKTFPRVRTLPINVEDAKANINSIDSAKSLFTKEQVAKIVADLEECAKVADSFSLEQDYSVITRFLSFMLDQGIPRTREVYRELYRALELYDCVPEHVKRSHKSTTSKDPHSNYIKSLVNTIIKNTEFPLE